MLHSKPVLKNSSEKTRILFWSSWRRLKTLFLMSILLSIQWKKVLTRSTANLTLTSKTLWASIKIRRRQWSQMITIRSNRLPCRTNISKSRPTTRKYPRTSKKFLTSLKSTRQATSGSTTVNTSMISSLTARSTLSWNLSENFSDGSLILREKSLYTRYSNWIWNSPTRWLFLTHLLRSTQIVKSKQYVTAFLGGSKTFST